MAPPAFSSIEHVVVLMLENRSFDHMLGYLYSAEGNVSPAGQPFDGLTGNESNPDSSGSPVKVFKIEPTTPNAYFMPGADPGEGYMATNDQLFGTKTPAAGAVPANQGFVSDFAYTLGWKSTSKGWSIVPGTTASDIMGCFTPEALPVLSGLARGYAVCDQWFASAPTETMPNRAFAQCRHQPGPHGRQDPDLHLAEHLRPAIRRMASSWAVYGYDKAPLTKHTFTDIAGAPAANFGLFADFHERRGGRDAGARSRSSSRAGARHGQQPAPELRRRPRRAADPRRVRTRCAGGPAGPARCWSSPTTSTAAATTMCARRGARSRRTTTPASSASTSPGSARACRPSWCRR